MLFLEDVESANVFNSIEKDVYYNKNLTGFNTTTYNVVIREPEAPGYKGQNIVIYDFNISDIPEKYKCMYVYIPENLNAANHIVLYKLNVIASNYGNNTTDSSIRTINNKLYRYINLTDYTQFRCAIAFNIDNVSILFTKRPIEMDELYNNNLSNRYIDIYADSEINSLNENNVYIVNLGMFVDIKVLNANPNCKYFITQMYNNHLSFYKRHIEIYEYNLITKSKQQMAYYDKSNENNEPPLDIEHICLKSLHDNAIFDLYIDWTKGNNAYSYKYAISDKYYQYIDDRCEDICTAYDNRVYDTPGNAIRNQITDIYDKYRYHLIDAESMNVFEFIEKDVYYNKRITGFNTSTFDKIISEPDGNIGKNCILYDFNISDIPEKYKYMYVYTPDDLNLHNYVILYTVGTRADNYGKHSTNMVTIDNRKYLVFKSSTFRNYEKCLLGFKKDAVLVLFSETDLNLKNTINDYIDINANSDITSIGDSDLYQFVKIFIVNARIGYKYYLTNVWNNHVTAHTRHISVNSYNIFTGEKKYMCDYDKVNENDTIPTDIETIVLNSISGPETVYIQMDWTKGNNAYAYKYPINDKYYHYSAAANKTYECIMPSKMICIAENKYNIYYNTLFRYIDTNNSIRRTTSNNKIVPYRKFAKYTPSESTSDFTVYINFSIDNNQIIDYSSNSIVIKTIPKNAGSGLTKKLLIIGDSLTDAGVSSRELKQLFTNDVMNIEFIGTRDDNTNEGYSGWRAYTFVCCDNQNKDFTQTSCANPFYNPSIEGPDDGTSKKFDFEYYMINQGYSGVDYVIICLGTNDVARGNHKGDEMKELWDFMINNIKSYNPNVKIGLWLPPTRAMCDNSFKINIDGALDANKWIIENYDNREDENIFLIPAQFVVDPETDYNINNTPADDRNPSVLIKTCNDTVHPKASGYNKIADLMYGYIKYFGYLDSQQ